MARPRSEHPTPAELEVLQVLWERGEATVREVKEVLDLVRPRAYTTVMSLLNVMAGKGLVERGPAKGNAFAYRPGVPPRRTLSGLLRDVLRRGFGGSPGLLVEHLLREARPTAEEVEEIRRAVEEYRKGGRQGRRP